MQVPDLDAVLGRLSSEDHQTETAVEGAEIIP